MQRVHTFHLVHRGMPIGHIGTKAHIWLSRAHLGRIYALPKSNKCFKAVSVSNIQN